MQNPVHEAFSYRICHISLWFIAVQPSCYRMAHCAKMDSTIMVELQETWQVEHKPGGRGRGREWPTLGVHPLSWLLSNNRLEKVPFVSVPHTSFNWLLLSNQDKGCTPSVAHSLALPLGPALLNLWYVCMWEGVDSCKRTFVCYSKNQSNIKTLSDMSPSTFLKFVISYIIVLCEILRWYDLIESQP